MALTGNSTEGDMRLREDGQAGDSVIAPAGCDDDTALESSGRVRARKRWVTVEPVTLMYVCFLAFSQPLTSQYVYTQVADARNYTGHQPGSDDENCTLTINTSSPDYIAQNAVQQESARWMIYINVAEALPAIVSTILLTGYCDRVGRKLPMILPIVGITLRSAICLVIVALDLHVSYIIAGCVLEGCFGGFPCVFMAVFAFLADITTPEQRTLRVIVVDVATNVGGFLALLFGGYMIDTLGFLYPFAIMLGINVLNFLYTWFFIPETIARTPGTKAVSLDHVKDALNVYCKQEPATRRRSALLLCLGVVFFANAVVVAKQDCEVYHLLAQPLCWTSSVIGLFQALVLLVGMVSSLGTTALLRKKLGDYPLVLLGCMSGIAYEVMFALAGTTTVVFLTTLVGQWYLITVPVVRSLASKLVQPHEQGALFSGISLVQLCSVMAGFAIFDTVYQATLDLYASAVFFLMAGCLLVALLLGGALMMIRRLSMKADFNYDPIFSTSS